MSNQDLNSGLYGGPASDTSAYRRGLDLRMIRENAESAKFFRENPFIAIPLPIQQTDPGLYYDPTPRNDATGDVSLGARTPRRRTEWDENPGRCIRDLALPLAVSAFIIWPILAVTGALRFTVWLGQFPYDGRFPELLGYGVPALLLIFGSFVLASFKIDARDKRRQAAAGVVPFTTFAKLKAQKLKS